MTSNKVLISRILIVLAGSITAASTVPVWSVNAVLGLLGAFVAGVAALNLPQAKA